MLTGEHLGYIDGRLEKSATQGKDVPLEDLRGHTFNASTRRYGIFIDDFREQRWAFGLGAGGALLAGAWQESR